MYPKETILKRYKSKFHSLLIYGLTLDIAEGALLTASCGALRWISFVAQVMFDCRHVRRLYSANRGDSNLYKGDCYADTIFVNVYDITF